MTKKKISPKQEESTPEIEILPTDTTDKDKENPEKISKEHKKSRIAVTEKKLVELEEVAMILILGRKAEKCNLYRTFTVGI